jgi:hypothetical protein
LQGKLRWVKRFIFGATGKKADRLKIPKSAEYAGTLGTVMIFSTTYNRSFL